jgi:electron transport complex protein RnfA
MENVLGLASVILTAALVNNVLLTSYLGLCPLLGVSNRFASAIAMSMATVFVLTFASGICFLLEHLLLQPFQLGAIRIVAYIVVIASMVKLTELSIRHYHPVLHRVLGLFLPLITTNCAVLGVALLNARQPTTFAQAIFMGLGSALGFALVLVSFSAIRERIESGPVPALLSGSPIALITVGILAMAFSGFSGLG